MKEYKDFLKFNKVYRKLLLEKTYNLNGSLVPLIFETYYNQILLQTVKDPELIPIPDDLFQYISNLSIKSTQTIQKISYQKIKELCYNFQYQLYQDFFKGVDQFAKNPKASLFILICKKENISQYLKNYFSKEYIDEFLKDLPETATGLTKRKFLDLQKVQNCLIFVDFQKLQIDGDKEDSLQHQLTHFIQHTVGLVKTLEKAKIVPNKKYEKQINELIVKLTSVYYFDDIVQFQNNLKLVLNYILSDRELVQTIKKVLNGFQRMYERQYIEYDKFRFISKLNYSKVENSNKSNYQKQRYSWLFNKLSEINDQSFMYSDSFFSGLNSIKNHLQKNDFEYRKFSQMWIYIGYFALKYINYPIDSKLKQHFKIFEMRKEKAY